MSENPVRIVAQSWSAYNPGTLVTSQVRSRYLVARLEFTWLRIQYDLLNWVTWIAVRFLGGPVFIILEWIWQVRVELSIYLKFLRFSNWMFEFLKTLAINNNIMNKSLRHKFFKKSIQQCLFCLDHVCVLSTLPLYA
jgi:hypothetical protein